MPETKEDYPCDECETRVENVYPDCQIDCDRYTDHYKKILLEVEKRSKKKMKHRYAYIVYAWFSPVGDENYIETVGVCTSRKAAIDLMETYIRVEAKCKGKDWIEKNNGYDWRDADEPVVNIISIEGPDMREAILQCDRYTMLSYGKPRIKRPRRKKKNAGEQMCMPL